MIRKFQKAYLPDSSDSFCEIRRKLRLWDACTLVIQGIIVGVFMTAFMCFVLI